MTDQQMNVAIAEACGWNIELSMLQSGLDIVQNGKRKPLPSYCTDLNAMHEAEKNLSLPNGEKREYFELLCLNYGGFGAIAATARQRAEAFLRTIGKWEGE